MTIAMELHELLVKVQSLDEPAKKKVLIVSSAVIMIAVIAVWLAYFNSIVTPALSDSAATTTPATAPAVAPAPSATGQGSPTGFWTGVGNSFSAAWQGFAGMFGEQHQYIVPKQ